MDRAHGVRNRALGMLFLFTHGFDRSLKVARIIHRIKYTKHVHTIDGRSFNKPFNDVISIVAIAQDILSTEQHLLRRVGHGLF